MFNVNRLHVLCEVAERGSLSGAALALSYTQSAVSQQIATLEAEAGAQLLERHGRGVRLTDAGAALVDHAEGILARLRSAAEELSEIAGLRGGTLRMASFPTAGATLMPLAIATFRARYPDVELTLEEGEPEQIAPRLGAGELDLALLFEFAPTAVRSQDGLERVELLEDPLFLAMRSDHPLAARRRLRLEHLSNEAWIQTSRASACAREIVRACHAAGFEPRVSFESDDYQTVQGLVAAGVGVALIPELALSGVRQDISVRTLSPRPPARRVVAARAQRSHRSAAAPAMVEILRDVAARYRPLRVAA